MEHYGVYGVWLQNGQVVAIRKARGPYTGMLDLPGGSPEPGETATDTLIRELREECGVSGIHVKSWHDFDFHVNVSSSGQSVDLHHSGLVALVAVQDEIEMVTGVEDVHRIELIDISQHSNEEFTPGLAFALELLASEDAR